MSFNFAEGRLCVELGCGLGVCGLAAASLGARVILTDGDDDILKHARAAAISNDLDINNIDHHSILRWGGDEDAIDGAIAAQTIVQEEINRINSNTEGISGSIDYILATDVLYGPLKPIDPLYPTLEPISPCQSFHGTKYTFFLGI